MSAEVSENFAKLSTKTCVLVADIGGTKTTTAWIGPDGQAHARHTTSSRALLGPRPVLGVIIDGLSRSRQDAESRGYQPVGIGVGSAGVIDRGLVTSATDAITDWVGTDISGELVRAFDLPAKVLNDVHAHGLGEAILGAGRGKASMILVAVGTGIGGTIISGNGVLAGARAAAGHIGHVSVPEAVGVMCPCGKMGHLEGLASGTGILRAYKRQGGTADTTQDVFARAVDGDAVASAVVTDAAFATGRAIGDLLNIVDPEVVVASGGIAETGDIWWEPLRRGVTASVLNLLADTPVVRSVLGPDAPLVGAGYYALTHA